MSRKQFREQEHVNKNGVKYLISPMGFPFVVKDNKAIDICTICSTPENLVELKSIPVPFTLKKCPKCGKDWSFTD